MLTTQITVTLFIRRMTTSRGCRMRGGGIITVLLAAVCTVGGASGMFNRVVG